MSTNCDHLPGIWRGLSQFNPLSERYNFAWNPTNVGTEFYVTNLYPGPGEWTYANGTLMNGNTSATMYFPEKNVLLAGPLDYNCTYLAWNNTSEWVKDIPITNVHFIMASHLDVGFTDLIIPSLNNYYHNYYPRAYSLIEQTRNTSYEFRYLTQAWLLQFYLNCPSNFTLSNVTLLCPTSQEQETMIKYLQEGKIMYPASTFNVEYEMMMSATMGPLFFSIAQDLSDTYGIPRPLTISSRDVPGITRGILPILNNQGIKYISEGVNSLTLPTLVPSPAIWMDPVSNASVLYIQHDFGYGSTSPSATTTNPSLSYTHRKFLRNVGDANCAFIPGFTDAICFDWRGEGSGPPDNVQEIQQMYSSLQNEFPNATVFASSLDTYMERLETVKDSLLPTFTSEIGDAWMLGGAADPSKVTFYRQGVLAYEDCIRNNDCTDSNDIRLKTWRNYVVKTPEHTWGLYEISNSDSNAWSNEAFHQALVTDPNYARHLSSYIEQRQVPAIYGMAGLMDHPLVDYINERMNRSVPLWPVIDSSFVAVPTEAWSTLFRINDLTFRFDTVTGAFSSLVVNNLTLADPVHRLGVVTYRTYNDTDYNSVPNCPVAYGRGGDSIANPNSTVTELTMTELYVNGGGLINSTGTNRTFLIHGTLPSSLVTNMGGFTDAWINITIDTMNYIHWELQLFNKTATRLGEAIFVQWLFTDSLYTNNPDYTWYMDKIGTYISPLEVATNGGILQHAVGQGIQFMTNPGATTVPALVALDTIDAPVMIPETVSQPMSVLPIRTNPLTDPVIHWGSVVYTNLWVMNYPLWSLDTDFRFRFRLRTDSSGTSRNTTVEK